MMKIELINRLNAIHKRYDCKGKVKSDLAALLEDIKADGVLDVQAPSDIAEGLKLPKQKKRERSIVLNELEDHASKVSGVLVDLTTGGATVDAAHDVVNAAHFLLIELH